MLAELCESNDEYVIPWYEVVKTQGSAVKRSSNNKNPHSNVDIALEPNNLEPSFGFGGVCYC